jgi:hypothetical protein
MEVQIGHVALKKELFSMALEMYLCEQWCRYVFSVDLFSLSIYVEARGLPSHN